MKYLQHISAYISLERGCNRRSDYREMSFIQVGPKFEQFYMMNCAMKDIFYLNYECQLPVYYRKYGDEDLALLLTSCLWDHEISLKSEEFSSENCPFVC